MWRSAALIFSRYAAQTCFHSFNLKVFYSLIQMTQDDVVKCFLFQTSSQKSKDIELLSLLLHRMGLKMKKSFFLKSFLSYEKSKLSFGESLWLYGLKCSSFILSVQFLKLPDLLWHTSIFTHYLSAAAPLHRTRPGPCRRNTAACPPLAAPRRSELHMTAAAPDTLCDLMERKKRRMRTWELTWQRASTLTIPFLAASWMGDASWKGVWMEWLCCRMSRTQAALPLLQELKRGVAPSVDTNPTCGGSNTKPYECK